MALTLKIVTPQGLFYEGEVKIVDVKTTEGYLGFLENHTPLVARIVISSLMFRTPDQKQHNCEIAGGLIYARPHDVHIVTDNIRWTQASQQAHAAAASSRMTRLEKAS